MGLERYTPTLHFPDVTNNDTDDVLVVQGVPSHVEAPPVISLNWVQGWLVPQ